MTTSNSQNKSFVTSFLNSLKWQYLLQFMIVMVLLVIFNVLADQYFFRWDLTEENRYSISGPTKNLLRDLNDVVYFEVYLTGDLPAGFQRLQRNIRETLEEFRVYADNKIQYKFVDPSQATSNEAKQEYYRSLAQKGIQPTNVHASEEGTRTQKLVFPGALVSYGGNETGITLLKGNRRSGAENTLNQSIEGIEYEFASAIRELTMSSKKRVALIKGQDELPPRHIAGLTDALSKYYNVFEVNLREKQQVGDYDAILICKPSRPFTKKDKYKLDQYIMNGGKALFFIDPVKVNMDSIGNEGALARPLDLNLTDLLFNYGIRLNSDLIKDLNAGVHPVVTGQTGDEPQIELMPWPYFPLINQYGAISPVRNLDATLTKFVSTIDTVMAEGVKKHPLLYTSQYTKKISTPVRVSLNELRDQPDPQTFRGGQFPIGYLLEGSFESLFKNRFLPDGFNKSNFKNKSPETKLAVFSDGDIIKNAINQDNNNPYPLGFDPYTQNNFANKELITNLMAYMTEENGIIQARNKEIKIRPLDKVKVEEEKLKWQFINLVAPVFLIFVFGTIRYQWRKYKYGK